MADTNIEHHHISGEFIRALKCIDIYIDHSAKEVRIVDTRDNSNRITISDSDWNELIRRVNNGVIGKVGV